MTDENFFDFIQHEQQKQKDRLSALQKILDATLKKQCPQQKKKFSLLKKLIKRPLILAENCNNQIISDK